MDLVELLDTVAGLMRQTKEDWVATGPENPDLAIYLQFFRGEEPVASAQCPLDAHRAVRAASIGACGFNTDALAMTVESYHSDLKVSPLTGNPWLHREMQYLAETDPKALADGVVNTCLITTAHERGGRFAVQLQPYRITDTTVEWLTAKYERFTSDDVATRGDGRIMAELQQAMASPTALELMAADASKNQALYALLNALSDPEAQLFHCDMATMRALRDQDLVTEVLLFADEGTNREKWLSERMGDPSMTI